MLSFTRVLLPALAALLTFTACQEDDDFIAQSSTPLSPTTTSAYANTPEALWDYFQRFETAAAQNGVAIDLTSLNISAEFKELPQEGVAGTCTYGSHQPGHIVIDETFWQQSSDLWKEMIVFHELGHCVLFRDHWEGILGDGTCESIMRSGLEACRDNYRWSTRADYLEELFARGER